MFRLTDQVGRDNVGVSGLVGNDGDLGGTCEHVDTDPAIQDSLGFGDKAIPRTHQDVSRVPGEKTKGHRGDPLNTTQGQNGIGTGEVSGVQNRRMNACIAARR